MKKQNFMKIARYGSILMALFAIVAVVFGSPETATGFGLAVAIPGATTTTNTAEKSPDLLLNTIEKKITEVAPDRAPMDNFIRQIKDRSQTNTLKVEYYAVDYKAVKDTVATAVTAAGQDKFNLVVNNIDIWAENDTIFFDGLSGYNSTGTAIPTQTLGGFVYGIDRDTDTLRIQLSNGYISGGVPTLKAGDNIALNSVLRRGGRAGQEEDIQTTPYADMPEKEYNYMQKFMAQIEITDWAEKHEKEIPWNFSDYSRRQITNMRIEKEMSYINGIRGKITSKKNGKDVYLAGGAKQFVTGLSDWSSESLGNPLFQKFTRECFEGNAGSDQRIMFVGDILMQKMASIDDISNQTSAKKRETNLGLTFNRINTNFGELLIVKHPLFGLQGMGNEGLVIDPAHIAERYFEPMQMIDLDLKKSGQRAVQAKVIIETSCALFRYPATHRWVKGPS